MSVLLPRLALMSAPALDADRDFYHPDSLEIYRRQLTGYCYRMLGSCYEAEDAVQETMLRALRSGDSFEGRASLRSWLYRIATNICLDMLRERKRRASPVDLGPSSPPHGELLGPMQPESEWITPAPDGRIFPETSDPADIAVARETVRLAFVTALQHLPARQRAALILFQVLRFDAAEVADLLDTTKAAVNSALQRARATLAALPEQERPAEVNQDHSELLARYMDAFERYDIDALVDLLHDDVIQSMPPFAMWLRGADDLIAWMVGPGAECRGSRVVPVVANGCPGFGQYRRDPQGGHVPWALHVLEISDGRVAEVHAFLDTARLFPLFGLPDRLPAAS
jgi:RNA polymerase sigma-70 factor, ECF subfamily